jgi:hypothetical protein
MLCGRDIGTMITLVDEDHTLRFNIQEWGFSALLMDALRRA